MTDGHAWRSNDARVQDGMAAVLAHLRRQEKAGATLTGWKVQLSSPGIRRRLDLAGPLVGPVTDATAWGLSDTHAVPAGRCFVEVELALELGRDVPPGAALWECEAAVSAAAPGLEILAVDGPFDDVETILAHNGYHAGVAFGPWEAPPRRLRNHALGPALRIEGQDAGEIDLGLAIGEPAEIVRYVADLLADFGQSLRAGQRLICGALNHPLEVQLPATVEARLDPFGAVTLNLAKSLEGCR